MEYHLGAALDTAPVLIKHSGAGLFNAQGELVGIADLLMHDLLPDDDPGVEPGNLFAPVDVLLPVIDELVLVRVPIPRAGARGSGSTRWSWTAASVSCA